MTLVELMIATAVAAVLSAAALQLFASLIKYSRLSAMTTDLNDRVRVARDLISHDLLRAGYYWAREQLDETDPANPIATGTFGSAALATGMTNWPTQPLSAQANTDKTDVLYLLVPSDEATGVKACGNAAHTTDARCYDQDSAGTNIVLTKVAASTPWPAAANLALGQVMIGTGTGITIISPLTAAATTGNDGISLTGLAGNTSATPPTGCALTGSSNDAPLPKRFSVYPVEGVAWMANSGKLLRCSVKSGDGPLQYDGNAPCSDNFIVMKGIEDLQLRYRFLQVELDTNGATTSASTCWTEDPTSMTDPLWSAALQGTNNCGDNRPKRRMADATAGVAIRRFIGLEIGLVGRTLVQDFKEHRNMGHPPTLFDHAPSGTDSYLRSTHIWKSVVPNANVF